MAKEDTKTNSYSAKDIQVLEGLEPVRKRPGMYIGSTGVDGLHHLIWEVFDNSLDEAMAGHAKNIEVALLPDNKVRVVDDGRGIPTDIHPKTKKSALETAATTLHAGGKFDGDSYKISGGLHGVGLSVVNALSSWMRAEVHRKPDLFAQEYKIGKPQGPVKKIGKTSKTGTTITFQPDTDIFKEVKFDWQTILNHLRQQAYLTKGVKIDVKDETGELPYEHTFYFEGGIVSYVGFLNRHLEAKHKNIFYAGKDVGGIFVEVALQYVEDLQSKELSFANNIHTIEGGTHLTGFRAAITRTLNDYARKNGFLKEKEDNLSGEDVREGLTTVISVKLREPQFEGQTKGKLGTPEARNAVETVVNSEFTDWLDRNPTDAREMLEKVILASKARMAAKAARDTVLRKGALEGMTLPGKLRDCSSRDASESELFIVEGDSAGGSATQGRNRHTQAILPIKGKILNVEKARIDKMLASQEVRALIIAMGTAIAEEFDIARLRYHKIVIMTDADSVTPETPILIFDKEKQLLRRVKIGNFVEKECEDTDRYQVLACDLDNKTFSLRNINKTIRHPIRNKLFEITSRYGYKIKATANHSVFIYKDGEFVTVPTSEIKVGDKIITPINMPRFDKDIIFDLKPHFKSSQEVSKIRVKIPISYVHNIPDDAWVDIALDQWKRVQLMRQNLKVSRVAMGSQLGIYSTVLQQWESKIDNVMPRYDLLKKYFNHLNVDAKPILESASIFIPPSSMKEGEYGDSEYFFNNHSRRLKTLIKLDEDLAYVLGWYIGDGCYSYQKNNPNRFIISLGKDKKIYAPYLKEAIKRSLNSNAFIDHKKDGSSQLVFHSFEFSILLRSLNLLNKKSYEKFAPSEMFNSPKCIQEAFLKGYLQSDGCIIVKDYKKGKTVRLSFTTASEALREDVVVILRQLGIFPGISSRYSRDHFRKDGVLISSKRLGYIVNINGLNQLKRLEPVWRNHKNSKKLTEYLKTANSDRSSYKKELLGNSVLLPVTSIKEIEPQGKFVYDRGG